MRVLIACEFSGIVRDAFAARGHDAWSCDLLPAERPGNHLQCDVLTVLKDGWDLMIGFPPCTYLTTTGNKWNKPEFKKRFPERNKNILDAISFFISLINAPIHKIAIENPKGIMSSKFRKPDQYINPYLFGVQESKMTGLWLKSLPLLKPTERVEPIWHIYKNGKRDPRWHMETMVIPLKGGQRSKERSRTYKMIAEAMAAQWG